VKRIREMPTIFVSGSGFRAAMLICLLALSIAPLLIEGRAHGASLIQKGSQVQGFEVPLSGGGSLKLSQELGKVPVLLLYWSLYCEHCREDLPQIQKMYERMGPSKVKVLAINGDGMSATKMVQGYWQKQRFTFVSLMDEEKSDGFLVEGLLGVAKTPAAVLVNRAGVVLFSQEGVLDLAGLEENIRKAN
jgi:cytochrome c biogenesis protein CcmG, thiol:disulfide interchange protein DsbE